MKAKRKTSLILVMAVSVLLMLAFMVSGKTHSYLSDDKPITMIASVSGIDITLMQDTRPLTVANNYIYFNTDEIEGGVPYTLNVSLKNNETSSGYYIRFKVIAKVGGTLYNINDYITTNFNKSAVDSDGFIYNTANSTSTTATALNANQTKVIINTLTIPSTATNGKLGIDDVQGKNFQLYLFVEGSPDGNYATEITPPSAFIMNGTTITGLTGEYANATHIVIPDGVTAIASSAFANNTNIQRVTIPGSVQTIGSKAFMRATNLQSIILEPGVQNIGLGAFAYTPIENITLPSTVKTIGGNAFQNCENLKEIYIPASVTSIGNLAFGKCYSLEKLEFSSDSPITTLPTNMCRMAANSAEAEERRSQLTTVILPDGITTIGSGSFCACANLTNIVIPDGVTAIDKSAFECCFNLKTINLPKDLTEIGNFAFNMCGELEIDLVLPSGLKRIGKAAFQLCSKIKGLTLNEGLKWIGDFAFNHCSGITNTTITIPSTVVQLGGESYVGDNETNKIIGSHVFYNCATDYLTNFVVANGNTHFKVDNNGVLYTKNNKYLVAYPSASTATSYEILEGCERIFELGMSRAFNLKTLTISDSLTIEYTNTITMPENFNNPQMNPLMGAIYVYTSIENFVVKDTNTKYDDIDGVIYSLDHTRVVAVPLRNWKMEGTNKVLEFVDDCTTIENIFSHKGSYSLYNGTINGRPNIVRIGANITSIDEKFIADLNALVNTYGASAGTAKFTIEIDINNQYYQLVNNKIVAK